MIRNGIKKRDSSTAQTRWIVVLLSVLVVLLSVISRYFTLLPQMNGANYMDVKPGVSVDIYYGNGNVGKDLPEGRWIARLGDRVQMNVKLPEAAPYTCTYLCFSEYNCLTEFSIEGEPYIVRINGNDDSMTYTDYLSAELERTYMLGNIQYMVPIPHRAWGKTLTIDLWPQEINNYTLNSYFYLMPGSDVRYQPLIEHEAEFFIYICAIVGGALGTAAGLLGLLFRKNTSELLLVSMFVLFISSWYFGRYHLLYVLFSNVRLCAKMEYYAQIATPMFMSWYLARLVRSQRNRKIFNWLGFGFLAVFLVLTFTMLLFHIPLCDTLYPFQLLALVALLLTLVINIRSFFTDTEPSVVMMMGGMVIATALLAIQIISIRGQGIAGLPDWTRSLMDVDYVSWVLFVIIVTMTYTLVMRSTQRAKEIILKETLEELAYVDSLTGIPNRTSVTENMEKLVDGDSYAVVFIDVDHLKHANDTYGHKAGDMLIRMGADAVKEAFGDSEGFYGRWGGDEFVAFVKDSNAAESFRERIGNVVEMSNRAAGEHLAVPLQMSVGVFEHPAGDSRSARECLNEADKLMYEDKMSRRRIRGASPEQRPET